MGSVDVVRTAGRALRLALAPDVRLVRASDCTSGRRVLSDARVCTAETDHSERDVESSLVLF